MDQLKKLYMDQPKGFRPVQVDDFIVAVGVKQSNSVYHVAEVRIKQSPKHTKMNRCHMKVYKSDLITALRRDNDQALFPMTWYKRKKKCQ